MNTTPKKQKDWLTADHNSLKYFAHNNFLKNLEYHNSLRIKRLSPIDILFLDELKLGINSAQVIGLLGDPFFIYNNFIHGDQIQVFSYGLKSGRNNLKVRLHFINNIFNFGTIEYKNYLLKHEDINTLFGIKYKLTDFIFFRDIIVDSAGNSLSFHKEQDTLIVLYSKLTT